MTDQNPFFADGEIRFTGDGKDCIVSLRQLLQTVRLQTNSGFLHAAGRIRDSEQGGHFRLIAADAGEMKPLKQRFQNALTKIGSAGADRIQNQRMSEFVGFLSGGQHRLRF